LNLADQRISGTRKEYIEYLFLLYDIETEDGIDMGDYPSYEEFLVIREEEANSYY
jgi:hypothetical protein